MARKDVIVVSSVSCIYGLGAPDEYIKGSVKITAGEIIDRRKILSELVHIHYSRNDQVLERGNIRVLGDIIEVFPWVWIYFISFILLNAVIMLNMVIGIIVDVMSKKSSSGQLSADENQ